MLTVKDEQLSQATGLSRDGIRKLIDWQLIAPENPDERGRGKKRAWSDQTVGIAASVAAIKAIVPALGVAAAIYAAGQNFWMDDGFPSNISPEAGDEFEKFLKQNVDAFSPSQGDLAVLIYGGRFVYRDGPYKGPHFLGEIVDDLFVTSEALRVSVEKFLISVPDRLPLSYQSKANFERAEQRAQVPIFQEIIFAKVNLTVCRAVAKRKVLSMQGFLPTIS